MVEGTEIDLESGSDDEGLAKDPFVPLRLSETEVKVVVWVFGLVISFLAAGAAASSEEASRALDQFVVNLTFFLVSVEQSMGGSFHRHWARVRRSSTRATIGMFDARHTCRCSKGHA